MTAFDKVKDSGERRDFGTGSVRDVRTGKGRYDLLPPMFIKRLAQHLENGAVKYGDNNWKLGQPLGGYLDSGLRHGFNCLEGLVDEDHPAAAAWNFMAFMWTAEEIKAGRLPRHLDDIGYVDALEEAETSQCDVEDDGADDDPWAGWTDLGYMVDLGNAIYAAPAPAPSPWQPPRSNSEDRTGPSPYIGNYPSKANLDAAVRAQEVLQRAETWRALETEAARKNNDTRTITEKIRDAFRR